MLRSVFALLLSFCSACHAAPPLPCSVSVYAVEADGTLADSPLLASTHVASVVDEGLDRFSGKRALRVGLTPQGTEINRAYSQAHVGDKLAIFCGGQEVSRPVIVAPSQDEFIVLVSADES